MFKVDNEKLLFTSCIQGDKRMLEAHGGRANLRLLYSKKSSGRKT